MPLTKPLLILGDPSGYTHTLYMNTDTGRIGRTSSRSDWSHPRQTVRPPHDAATEARLFSRHPAWHR